MRDLTRIKQFGSSPEQPPVGDLEVSQPEAEYDRQSSRAAVAGYAVAGCVLLEVPLIEAAMSKNADKPMAVVFMAGVAAVGLGSFRVYARARQAMQSLRAPAQSQSEHIS